MKSRKNIRVYFAAVALLLMGVCSMVAQDNNHHRFANFKRYASSNNELNESPNDGRRVVLMGNSITQHWVGMRPEFFTDNNYIGRGISGQTSFQFLLRFREDVINLSPKILVLNYGTNDIAENTGEYDEDLTYGNVLSMVELARYHGIKVILTSCLPAGSFGWRPEIVNSIDKIRSLNARVKAYAEENQIPYVDYFSKLVSADGTCLDSKYTDDGVHPTVAGYEVMEAMIKPVIEGLR